MRVGDAVRLKSEPNYPLFVKLWGDGHRSVGNIYRNEIAFVVEESRGSVKILCGHIFGWISECWLEEATNSAENPRRGCEAATDPPCAGDAHKVREFR